MAAKVGTIHARAKKDGPRLPKLLRALSSKRSATQIAPHSSGTQSRRSSSGFDFFATVISQDKSKRVSKISFQDAFGLLGIPIVAIVLGCIGWTLWLIILSVAPNDAANFLMDTEELDSGQFWLIPDEWSILQSFSVAGLALVLVFYLYILVEILVWRSQKNVIEKKLDNVLACWRTAARSKASGSLNATFSQKVFSKSWKIYVRYVELTNIHGKNRKFWNVLMKFQDLIMLALLLHDLLEAGPPVQIAYGLAAMAALNSFTFAAGIVLCRCSALVEVLVDSMFDFGSTVLYPLTVLHYCTKHFHYDRAVYFINLEILPIGSFERRARMHANPAEIALVRTFFDSLRILDEVDFFLRIGMNLAFSYRMKRIVEVLIEMGRENHQHPRPVKRKRSLLHPPTRSMSVDKLVAAQRSVPKSLAILFVAYSVGILVITHKAIVTSQAVCCSHPECVVFAYRWHNTEICPCRAIVDGDPAPRTYHEWMNPIDATQTVRTLAAGGELETLQLINRQLTELPDELRRCHKLNFISLINCATDKLPVWLKDFHKLQYLQIEGKVGSENLGDFAEDLFANMPDLRYLQFGVHQQMLRLPPLVGAPKLRSILMSRLYNLVEISALTEQTNLERLEMGALKSLRYLPDLQPLTSLRNLIIIQGAQLCCNGFLGSCNLTDPMCKNTTCLEDPYEKATPSTLKAFQHYSYSVCVPASGLSQVPTAETTKMCGGIPFKQCHLPGLVPDTTVVGMCYNHRMQVLACNPDPAKIQVRRQQIQDGVGAACDPVVEAWLGCSKK